MQNLLPGPPENHLSRKATTWWEGGKRNARELSRGILSLVFPLACCGCNRLLTYPSVLCAACANDSGRIEAPYCRKCGIPFPKHWQVSVCPDCQIQSSRLTRLRSAFRYEGVVSQLIRDAKFRKSGRILRYFAGELVPLCLTAFPRTVEGLVPVPLHRSREWQRTFNQSELLAGYLSRYTGMPVCLLLKKKRETRAQSSLSGLARRANLRGAFQLRGTASVPRSVLLIDDVVTTGATLGECARVLRSAGVRRVYGLTVARALPE